MLLDVPLLFELSFIVLLVLLESSVKLVAHVWLFISVLLICPCGVSWNKFLLLDAPGLGKTL